MEFWRLREIESCRGGLPRVLSAVVEGMLIAATPGSPVAERMDVEDEERWCMRVEGAGWEGPERRWFALWSA